ncbi:hypothetical protein GJV07_23110 [Enterobacteriaceae bacterium RIT711]|nr:hypothetical protein [Enterobacteriaceae bacterium RIT711]
MTPIELRRQADSLIQRGLYRRAANVLQLISAHSDTTEAERDRAQADASKILGQHCQMNDEDRRARDAAMRRAKRAAAKDAAALAAKLCRKPGDGMRAAVQRANRIKAARQCSA